MRLTGCGLRPYPGYDLISPARKAWFDGLITNDSEVYLARVERSETREPTRLRDPGTGFRADGAKRRPPRFHDHGTTLHQLGPLPL